MKLSKYTVGKQVQETSSRVISRHAETVQRVRERVCERVRDMYDCCQSKDPQALLERVLTSDCQLNVIVPRDFHMTRRGVPGISRYFERFHQRTKSWNTCSASPLVWIGGMDTRVYDDKYLHEIVRASMDWQSVDDKGVAWYGEDQFLLSDFEKNDDLMIYDIQRMCAPIEKDDCMNE